MAKTINNFKAAIAAAVGLLTGLWGWLGWLAVGWIGAMVLDYITGSMAAAKEGEWSSARAREGIWHKGGMFVVVLVAAGTDMLLCLVLANLPLVALPFEYDRPRVPGGAGVVHRDGAGQHGGKRRCHGCAGAEMAAEAAGAEQERRGWGRGQARR